MEVVFSILKKKLANLKPLSFTNKQINSLSNQAVKLEYHDKWKLMLLFIEAKVIISSFF